MGKKKKPKAPAIDLTPIWNTYNQQRNDLTAQRDQMFGQRRAEMAAGGLERGSVGWNQGLDAVASDFQARLTKLGADAYYNPIRGQAGFGEWGDVTKASEAALAAAKPQAGPTAKTPKGAASMSSSEEDTATLRLLSANDEELWRV